VAFVTFATVLGFEFVYDDHWTIVRNKYLNWPLAPLLRASFSGTARALSIPDGTRPLMILTTWIDRRVFGLAPEGHHLHSLLWYVACSIAAYHASLAVTRRRRVALFAALYFAVAPVHAEVVASINYREDLLASLAVLVAVIWLFAPRPKDSLDGAVVVAGIFGLGLLGKESAAALPLMVAAILLSPRQRRRVRHRTRSLTALAVVFTLWAAWRIWLRAAGRDDVPLVREPRGLVERLMRTARYEVRAVIDSLWPTSWAPEHAAGGSPEWWWPLLLFGIVAVIWTLARRESTRGIAVGLLWAMAAPLVTSPLLSPINERTDRYLFLAVLGGGWVWAHVVVAVLGWVTARQWATPLLSRVRGLALAVPVALLAYLAIEARAAAAPWQSDATLWRTAVERDPLSARAWNGLAARRFTEGDLEGAEAAAIRAMALDPLFLRPRVRRLYVALARGDIDAARGWIAELEAMGGSDLLGMRAARRCVALPAEEAPGCIRGLSVHSPMTAESQSGVRETPAVAPGP
jgi:protein O-mannosyl-transferase